MKLIRKTVLANEVTEFRFDLNCTEFLVKNLTDGKILACLGIDFKEENSSAILPNCSEYMSINKSEETSVHVVNILAETSGEVEVQCLAYSEILSDIIRNLEIIANGIYGKDIRKAIHDSIQIIHNAEVDISKRESKLEESFNKQIKNLTLSSPSNAEIVDARGEFNLLSNRLDYITDINDKNTSAIDLNKIIDDSKVSTYVVTNTNENTFALPDNYSQNSLVEVFIDDIEQVNYTIQEVNFINVVVLENAISNSKVKIRCRNFKNGFIKSLINIIESNSSIG